MKRLQLLLALICLIHLHALGQAQVHWEWLKSFTPYAANGENEVKFLQHFEGHLYGVGTFKDSIYHVDSLSLTNTGGNDMYIAKWDTLGNLIWLTLVEGQLNESPVGLTFDSSNHVIFGFQSPSPTISINGQTILSLGQNDIYLAKLETTTGQTTWMQNYGGANNDTILNLCNDYSGAIYFSGVLNNNKGIAKIDNLGNYLFTAKINFPPKVITYSPFDSSIIASGTFTENLFTDQDSLIFISNLPICSPFCNNLYLLKMKLDGNSVWQKNISYSYKFEDINFIFSAMENGNIYFIKRYNLGTLGGGIQYVDLNVNDKDGEKLISTNIASYTYQNYVRYIYASYDPQRSKILISKASSYVNTPFGGFERSIFEYDLGKNFLEKKYDFSTHPFMQGIQSYNNLEPYAMLNGSIYVGGTLYNQYSLGKINGTELYVNEGSNLTSYSVCDSSHITLKSRANFGTEPYTYQWMPIVGLDSNNSANTTGFVNSSITYTITATDANNLSKSAAISYNVINTTHPHITASDSILCTNPIKLSSNFNLSYNNQIGSYGTWIAYDVNSNNYINYSTADSISTNVRQKFILRKYYPACVLDDTIQLSGPNLKQTKAFVTPSTTVCRDDSVIISMIPNGNYLTTNGMPLNQKFIPNTTKYTIYGLDSNNCFNSINEINLNLLIRPLLTQITYNKRPLILQYFTIINPVTFSATICKDDSISIHPNLYQEETYSITYSNGIQSHTFFKPATSMQIEMSITGPNGCNRKYTLLINVVDQNPEISISNFQNEICLGESTSLTATGATNYMWSDGISNGVPFMPSTTTTYSVIGTDVNGCSDSDSATVVVNPLPNLQLMAANNNICLADSTAITASGAVNYAWSGGISNGVPFMPLATTTYSVVGTDVNGCSDSDSATVVVNPLPNLQLMAANNNICLGDSTSLTASGAINYAWSGGISNGVPFVPSTTTTYSVVGTDVNGCSDSDSVTVLVNANPTTPQFYYDDIYTLISNDSAYQFEWLYNGQPIANSNLTKLEIDADGIYQLKVIDENGCFSLSLPQSVILKKIPTSFSIYPNPFRQDISLSFTSIQDSKLTLLLTDVSGRLIEVITKNSKLSKGKNNFKFTLKSNLAPGVYFLKMETDHIIQNFKLKKE